MPINQADTTTLPGAVRINVIMRYLLVLVSVVLFSCARTAPETDMPLPPLEPWQVQKVVVADTLVPAKVDEPKKENPVFKNWSAGVLLTEAEVADFGEERCFASSEIPDDVFSRMTGKSFPEDCTVSRDSLRYLKVLHYNLQGEILTGELVCNHLIANDLCDVFRELFQKQYPIEKIRLIDDYDADDEASMTDNNTSCFCFRALAGAKQLSMHALGMAVDVNPLYNPYVRDRNGVMHIQPRAGEPYSDRSLSFDYKIQYGDECQRTFRKYGFFWGGLWPDYKDYQHFYTVR